MKRFLWFAVPAAVLVAMYAGHEYGRYRFGHGKTSWTIFEESGSDSSPIIVGSGSVHFREVGFNIHPIDQSHGFYDLASHKAIDVKMGWCPSGQAADSVHCRFDTVAPPGASVGSPMAAPWTLQLNDSIGGMVGAMHVDDASLPGFMMLSTGDPSRVLNYDPDDGNNGTGLQIFACAAGNCTALANPLGSAVLTSGGSTYNLSCQGPAPAGKALCSIRIRYCDTGKVDEAHCK